ncbi:MAG TPA: c-type cytochrome [Gemmatimonadaceae bacterium]|nr:c-type cytochrome [Gemmatimonadaceae bacterium]
MRRLLVGLLSLTAISRASDAQFPPERTKNLKVLPMDIPIRALVDTMAGFTRALGVRCTYCHVGREGEPLATYDFAADEKTEKAKAREMLRMVTAINSDHLAKLASRRAPRITVTCATCHHGVSQPRPLQQVLMIAYDAGGTDSAVAAYRVLRARYYGSAAYDFGEVPLVDVANRLREQNHLADALRLYLLNTELSPNSGFAFRMAADGQLAAGDTAAAVASLRRAVAINANDRQATQALEQLAKKPLQSR